MSNKFSQQKIEVLISITFQFFKHKLDIRATCRLKPMCFFNVGAEKSPAVGNILTYTKDYGSSEACGMDKSTGVFTVSTEGLYHFSIHITRYTKEDTAIDIRIDNYSVCTAWSVFQEQTEYGEGVSCSIVRLLKRGQKVDAYVRKGSLITNYLHNQFHGFLIR